MIIDYPYLNDENFLTQLDSSLLKEFYAKITLLNWNEDPIQEIQALVTGGNLNLDGQSAVRRTGSLSVFLTDSSYAGITKVENLFSINKKFYLEIGFKNLTNQYRNYETIWFPQGLFIINNASSSHSLDGTTINLNFKDKMCLLNGECGGVIPASTTFDKYETIDDNGEYIVSQPTIHQIITEIVNHFGGEQLGKILISDLDTRAKMVMRWVGNSPVYFVYKSGNNYLTTDYSEAYAAAAYTTYTYGEDIGYIYTDMTYTGDLVASAGNSCVTILDKIKDYLGNFEYFYDIYGNFRFQEIKNYINTSQTKIELENLKSADYIVDMSKGKAKYDFTNSKIITQFSNNPIYSKIKNDFVIWGIKNTDGLELPIRYHLAIDKKPEVGNVYTVFFYKDPDDGITKAKMPIVYSSRNAFPTPGAQGNYYMDGSTNVIYIWNPTTLSYITINGEEVYEYETKDNFPSEGDTKYIYLDKSTNISYAWAIDTNSDLYKEKQDAINTRTKTYTEELNTLKEEKDSINDKISEINELLNNYTEEDINEKIQENEELIAEKQKEYNNAVTTVEELANEINSLTNEIEELTTQIEAETDPAKKAILMAQKELDEVQKELDEEKKKQILTEGYEDLLTAKEKLENVLAEWKAILASYQSAQSDLETLNAQLVNINQKIADEKTAYDADIEKLKKEEYQYIETTIVQMDKVKTTDWRSELYLQGVAAEPLGLDSNYYYAELQNEWPKIYNLKANWDSDNGYWTGDFLPEVKKDPSVMDYFLDFIDTEAAIGELCVDNIGRRSEIESKNEINCIFTTSAPDFILIETGQDDTEERRQECIDRGQEYIQVDSYIYSNLATGGLMNSAYDEMCSLVYADTSYNESISITALPMYYIEPNVRIAVTDLESSIHGEFMINTISLPLSANGTMTISAAKVDKLTEIE